MVDRSCSVFLASGPSGLATSNLLLDSSRSNMQRVKPNRLYIGFGVDGTVRRTILRLVRIRLTRRRIARSPLNKSRGTRLRTDNCCTLFMSAMPSSIGELCARTTADSFTTLTRATRHLGNMFTVLGLMPNGRLYRALRRLVHRGSIPKVRGCVDSVSDCIGDLL